MNKRLNTIGCLLFIPGFPIQLAGLQLFEHSTRLQTEHAVGRALFIVGTVLTVGGYILYAKARNRAAAFGLLGLVGLVGYLFLYGIDDYSADNMEQ